MGSRRPHEQRKPAGDARSRDVYDCRRTICADAFGVRRQEADVAWTGLYIRHVHTLMHIERGTNIVRLSRLLSHHKPWFTLDVFGHLLEDGPGDPLEPDDELEAGARAARAACVV